MSEPAPTWSTRYTGKATGSSLPKAGSIEHFTDAHWGSVTSITSLSAGRGSGRAASQREPRETSATRQFSPLLVGADLLGLPDCLLRRAPEPQDSSAHPVAEPSTEKRRLPLVNEDEGSLSTPVALKYQLGSFENAASDPVNPRRPPPLDRRLSLSALSPLHRDDLSSPAALQQAQHFRRTTSTTTPLMGPSPLECTTPAAVDGLHRQSAFPRNSRSSSEQPSFSYRHKEDDDDDRHYTSGFYRYDGGGNNGGNEDDQQERADAGTDDPANGFVSIMRVQRSTTAEYVSVQPGASSNSGKMGRSGSARGDAHADEDDEATYFVSCMTPLLAADVAGRRPASASTTGPPGAAASVASSAGGRGPPTGGGCEYDSTRTPVTPLATGVSPSNSPYPADAAQQTHFHQRPGGSALVAVPPLGALGHLRTAGAGGIVGAQPFSGFGARGLSSSTAPVPATPTKPRPPSRVVTPQRFVTPRPSAATTPRPALEANENPFSQYRGHHAEVAMAELHISALVDQTAGCIAAMGDGAPVVPWLSSSSAAAAEPLETLPRSEVSDSDSSMGPGGASGGGSGLVLTSTPRHVPPHAQVAVHNQLRHHARQLTPQHTPTSQNAGLFPGMHLSGAHERTPSTAAHQTSFPQHALHQYNSHHHPVTTGTTSSARHSRVNSGVHDISPPPAMRPPLHPTDEVPVVGGGGERTSLRELLEFSPMVRGGESPSTSAVRTPNSFSNTASVSRPFPPPQHPTPLPPPDTDGGFLRRAPLFPDDAEEDDDDDFYLARTAAPPCSTASTETLPPQYLPTLLFGDNEESTAGRPVHVVPADLGYDEVEPGDRFRAARFSFLHHDPSSHDGLSQVVVPLHVDVNGTVWLARHYVDGLPYAVKEVVIPTPDTKGNGNSSLSSSSCLRQSSSPTPVSVELQALTIGNSNRSIVDVRAAQHMVRYHTTYVHKPTGVQVIQCEYLPRGNLAEALELHWASATQRIRQVLHTGKITTDDEKARLLRWFIKEVLPEPSEMVACMTHILMALDALHQHGMVHGNPIPWNVFLVTNYHYKLGNFGGAARVGSDRHLREPMNQTAADAESGRESRLGWYPAVGDVARFLPPSPLRHTKTPEQLDVYVFARSMMMLLWSQIRRAATYWNASVMAVSESDVALPSMSHLPSEVSLEALRASGPHGSGWHLYDDRVLACFESMLCAPSAAALLEHPEGRAEGTYFLACDSSALVHLAHLQPPNLITFHLQNAYDREIMKMLTTLEHLKRRREQLQRKVKRQALQTKERLAVGNLDEEGQLIRGASVLSLDNGEPMVKKCRTGEDEERVVVDSDDEDPQSPIPIAVTSRVHRGRLTGVASAVLDDSRVSDEPSPSPSSTFFASSSVESTPTISPKHSDASGGGFTTAATGLPPLPPQPWHSLLPPPSLGPHMNPGFLSSSAPRQGTLGATTVTSEDSQRYSGSELLQSTGAAHLLPPSQQHQRHSPPVASPQRSLVDMFDDMAPLAVRSSATATHVSWLQTSSASLCSSGGDLGSGAANRRRCPPKTLRTQPRNGYAHSSSLGHAALPPPSPPHAPSAHHPFRHLKQQHHCPHGKAPRVAVLPSTTVSAMLAYFHAEEPVSASASESLMVSMPLTAAAELDAAGENC